MLKKPALATLAAYAALAASAAGALAQQNPYTKASRPTPISDLHRHAQRNPVPDACAIAVAKASDDISLRIQGREGMDSRTTRIALLQAAQSAAAAGDEEACWHWFDKVQNFAR